MLLLQAADVMPISREEEDGIDEDAFWAILYKWDIEHSASLLLTRWWLRGADCLSKTHAFLWHHNECQDNWQELPVYFPQMHREMMMENYTEIFFF